MAVKPGLAHIPRPQMVHYPLKESAMNTHLPPLALATLLLAICQPVQAGWSDFLDKIIEPKEESRETTSDKRSTPDLNSTELSEGL